MITDTAPFIHEHAIKSQICAAYFSNLSRVLREFDERDYVTDVRTLDTQIVSAIYYRRARDTMGIHD